MFDIIDLLRVGLSLWLNKEKTKYQDEFLSLEGKYREAINKPDDMRDDLVIANLDYKLRQLSRSFVLASKGPPSQGES